MVVKQGDPGSLFYIILSGLLLCLVSHVALQSDHYVIACCAANPQPGSSAIAIMMQGSIVKMQVENQMHRRCSASLGELQPAIPPGPAPPPPPPHTQT